MDYNKAYMKFWEDIVNQKTLEAKKYFKNNKEKNRPFLHAHKLFIEKLREQLDNDVTLPLKTDYPEIFSIFNMRNELAENDPIASVLANDIKDLYLKNGNNLSEYSFIIEKLAHYEALSEISRNLYNHHQYLELVYKSEIWESFQLKDFEKGFLNDARYQEMKSQVYPAKEKIGFPQPPTLIEKNKPGPEKNESQKKYQNRIKTFTENEKKFILYVLAEFHKGNKSILQEKKLPFTEFLMALEITKSVYDERIFYAEPNSISYYTSIRKGIKLAPLGQSKMFLNSLIEKLDSLNFNQLQNLIAEWYSTSKTR